MANKIIKLDSFSDFERFAAQSPPCARDGPERREPGIFEKGVPYSERLKTYLGYSRSRGNHEFAESTCGICATATFRKCLKDYIKFFEPQKIFSDSEARISLHSDGVFAIEGENKGCGKIEGGKIEAEGEAGKTGFCLEILSYFNITCFWEELEKIRDFNYIKRPILIAGIDAGELKLIEAISHEALRERVIIYVAEPLQEHLRTEIGTHFG